MSDWADPTPLQISALQETILHAVPYPDEFGQLLFFALNKEFVQIAAMNANYRTAVYQVLRDSAADGTLPDLVKAIERKAPKNARVKLLRDTNGLRGVPAQHGVSKLEDIVRQDGGFTDVMAWLERAYQVPWRVCRIECPVNQAIGTGALVAENLVLTNWHVVRYILEHQQNASDYVCRFDYATTAAGTSAGTAVPLADDWCADWSEAAPFETGAGAADATVDQLDYALLRLAVPLGAQNRPDGSTRGWLPLAASPGLPPEGTVLFVFQHASGNPLKLSIGAVSGFNPANTRLLHDANTLTGSSGAPCLDAALRVVGLHNAGDPQYDGVIGAPTANRAVPIQLILSRMDSRAVPKFWQ